MGLNSGLGRGKPYYRRNMKNYICEEAEGRDLHM